MKRILIRIISFLGLAYLLACTYMYFRQEDFIFHPKILSASEKIDISAASEEIFLQTADGEKLSAVISTSRQTKGFKLIFYLHGNSGNLKDQNEAAKLYNDLGYDFFSFDYRAFGKSSGKQQNESLFYEDVRLAYAYIKSQYQEDSIVVIGYSLGTAPAAMITAENKPSRLLLIAPFYSLVEMTRLRYPWIPTFLLKYPFETDRYLREVRSIPTLLVHGKRDETIPIECSKKLASLLNESSSFVPIEAQDHNNFERNPIFVKLLTNFLKK